MSNLDLLPRADLPVIWNEFKTKADLCRDTAESLVVTDVSQKEAMALARKTRLTLREIRIAVEHKRVELGEGHLKEIQKVNGAAKAIREFIEPLEARLLLQESFAERAEADRIAELKVARTAEIEAIRPRMLPVSGLGTMKEADYNEFLARIKQEVAEIEAASRLRIEAERKLAEAQAEAERQRKETTAKLAAAEAEHKAQREAAQILAQREREAEEASRRQQQAKLDAEQAEKDRIRDEQLAVLEAELKAERAVKLAEAEAARQLALAPDLEQLRGFSRHLQQICKPVLKTAEAEAVLEKASQHFAQAIFTIDAFCGR